MDVKITSFKEEHWSELQKLIDDHWESDHPVTDSKLFFDNIANKYGARESSEKAPISE